ncbi:MAG: hypothetical protein R3E98_14895 [Gemmatimonadota bacterium]
MADTASLSSTEHYDTDLGSPSALHVDGRGIVWVGTHDGRVLRLESSEAPAVVAWQGDTPASRIVGLATQGEQLFVRDTAAVVALDPSGRALWRAAVPAAPSVYGRDALVATPGGALVATVQLDHPPFSRAAVRIDNGDVVDTIAVETSGVACMEPRPSRFGSGRFVDLRVRYVPMVHLSVGDDGSVLTGCTASYSIHRRLPSGPDVEIERRFRPVATAPDERDSFVKTWTAQMNNSGRADLPWVWEGAELPLLKPAFQRLLGDATGRTWVWPSQPSVPLESPPTWHLAGLPAILWTEPRTGAFDVWDEDGVLLGHVRLPSNVPFSPFGELPEPFLRGDTVWAFTADSTGWTGVGRFEIRWP